MRCFCAFCCGLLLAAGDVDDGHSSNRTCFWGAAARFERFWSLADYERFTSAKSVGGPLLRTDTELGLRHLYFVVTASVARAEYALTMEKAWMHAAAARIYLVDDLIPGLPLSCQVVMNDGQSLEGGHVPLASRDAIAVSRLMIWINQAKESYDVGGLSPNTRWVVIIGDDVYVNLARLYYFLAAHTSADDHPVMFSHVLSDTEVYDFDMPCLNDGGLILSRSAFDQLAKHASCKTCPFIGSDSMSLSYCSFYNAVPMVHVPGIHCHPRTIGKADLDLTADMLAHHWIIAGGLFDSSLGKMAKRLGNDQLLMHHPFEEDFPNVDCKLPSDGLYWTYQQLVERIWFCMRQSGDDGVHEASPPNLVDGSTLLPDNIDHYFDTRWPGSMPADLLEEVVFDGHHEDWPQARKSLLLQLHGLSDTGDTPAEDLNASWYFLRPVDAWLNNDLVGRFLNQLQASGLFSTGSRIAFAFVRTLQPDQRAVARTADKAMEMIDLRPGLLLSRAAAWDLAALRGSSATAAVLEELGITLVHTPVLVPAPSALPCGLTGFISAGALSGTWSVGQVASAAMLDDLEAKADDRRFFAGLLKENFEDLARAHEGEPCGSTAKGEASKTLRAAREWMRFLHDDDEHIKVVRGFQSGRREFRTLHAMYRSEAGDAPPLHGVYPDTVFVARNCPPHAE
eukprot:TRINITY_DN99545_c0_g1_i1.p1 TRINITY_DN99545_c0_g1~~TRINITY_DN99545_c0_g1_i1.p1  ORF type:complete len:680 (+),score=128.62 TRINITY_DN99545_c0_g1_i1:32-2071(+)